MNVQPDLAAQVDLLRMIVKRLERLSADSAWARISNGYRGSMLKLLDRLETKDAGVPADIASAEDRQLLAFLIDMGLELLARAAREIGDPELIANLPLK